MNNKQIDKYTTKTIQTNQTHTIQTIEKEDVARDVLQGNGIAISCRNCSNRKHREISSE